MSSRGCLPPWASDFEVCQGALNHIPMQIDRLRESSPVDASKGGAMPPSGQMMARDILAENWELASVVLQARDGRERIGKLEAQLKEKMAAMEKERELRKVAERETTRAHTQLARIEAEKSKAIAQLRAELKTKTLYDQLKKERERKEEVNDGMWSTSLGGFSDGDLDQTIAEKELQLLKQKQVKQSELAAERNAAAAKSTSIRAKASITSKKESANVAKKIQVQKGPKAEASSGSFFNPFSFSRTSGFTAKTTSQPPWSFSRPSTSPPAPTASHASKKASKPSAASKSSSSTAHTQSSSSGGTAQKASTSSVWSVLRRVKPKFK